MAEELVPAGLVATLRQSAGQMEDYVAASRKGDLQGAFEMIRKLGGYSDAPAAPFDLALEFIADEANHGGGDDMGDLAKDITIKLETLFNVSDRISDDIPERMGTGSYEAGTRRLNGKISEIAEEIQALAYLLESANEVEGPDEPTEDNLSDVEVQGSDAVDFLNDWFERIEGRAAGPVKMRMESKQTITEALEMVDAYKLVFAVSPELAAGLAEVTEQMKVKPYTDVQQSTLDDIEMWAVEEVGTKPVMIEGALQINDPTFITDHPKQFMEEDTAEGFIFTFTTDADENGADGVALFFPIAVEPDTAMGLIEPRGWDLLPRGRRGGMDYYWLAHKF